MRFDALVIGAGPAGSASALLLARAGLSVALFEKAAFPRMKVCGEVVSPAGLALLARLGVETSGRDLRNVALWCGERAAHAAMPAFPRALPRETLDSRLLDAARRVGAQVFQPSLVRSIERTARGVLCRTGEETFTARCAIDARGSPSRSAELLGFKARLKGARIPPDEVALAPLPGGYAGLVRVGEDATFACCVRRRDVGGEAAAARVFERALGASALLRDSLRGARVEGRWLATGGLRPGRRRTCEDGVFRVGNAAGEPHPVVGEGITMALQSALLLCGPLALALKGEYDRAKEEEVAWAYGREWNRLFSARLRAASLFARCLMHPAAPLLARAPGLLALAARWHRSC